MENYVQEAYYGKLPEFEELEKQFDKLIRHAKKDGIGKCNPNKYPEQKKICQIFSKLFGFKQSYIYWEPFYQANAYTYSLNVFMIYSDKKQLIEKRPDKGFYDSSHSIILTVYITTGLLEKNMSARELIAVILHEIGHNFDYSGYHNFESILYAITTFGTSIFQIHKYKNKTNDMKEDYLLQTQMNEKDYYDHQRKRDKINQKMKEAEKNYYKKQQLYRGLIFPLSIPMKMLGFVCSPVLQIADVASKKGELFADSFATAYGYGPDLISALNKLEDNKPIYNPKSSVNKFFFDLGKLSWEMTANITAECHSSNMERCQKSKEKLKWDLKHNDFPPQLKQNLVDEINSLTAMYKSYYTKSEDEQYGITKIYRKYLHLIWGGRPNLTKFLKRNKV